MADEAQDQGLPTQTEQEQGDNSSSDGDELKSEQELSESDDDDDGEKVQVLIEPCTFESQIYDDQKTVEPILRDLPVQEQKDRLKALLSNQKDASNAPRGIQSLYNSASSDCTLYSMFAFNKTFDYIFDPSLSLPCEPNSPLRILSRQVVTPLRKIGFVGAKRIVSLKLAIQRVGNLRTRAVVDVRKPERFLDDLLKYGLRLEHQLKLHDPKVPANVTSANSITVPVEYREQDEYITSSYLVEKWTVLKMKKLEAPVKNLVVNLDRKTGPFDEPVQVLPVTKISLGHCLHNVKRNCIGCIANRGALATVECATCLGSDNKHMNLSDCSYCDDCFVKNHHAESERAGHESIPISQQTLPANQIAKEGASVHDGNGISYPYELYAIICQNVTGYVAYACTDIDSDGLNEIIKVNLAPDEYANVTEEQPQPASAEDDGTTKPKNQADSNPPVPVVIPPEVPTPGSSMGSDDTNSEKKDTRLWVYYDPEAIVKEDVRGGFNVPQVYAVDDFQSLINHHTLDKTHGLFDANGSENVNQKHQYRILCESVALFYRPVLSENRTK